MNLDTAPDGWDPALSKALKEERLHVALRALEDIDELHATLDGLRSVDADYRLHLGGAILDALRAGGELDEALAEDFDNRYARLLALHSTVDLAGARAVNERGEALYRRFGKSAVRYARIGRSLETARGALARFAAEERDVVRVSPVADASFVPVALAEGAPAADVLSAGSPGSAVIRLALARSRRRAFLRLSAVDDTDAAHERWVEAPREDTIDALRFHVLADARVSCRPSAIVFDEGDGHRFASATGDMYHHARVAGRVGLGRDPARLRSAYFLPRYGQPENHYHTLVDKLPTLYGYKLLGLDCPLVAAYRPNATMHHLMDLLGIERERVVADVESAIVAERAVVPTPAALRPLFIDFCTSLPKGRSPVGPRVYIARGDANGRGMENEPEVEALLAAHGFDIVRMEEHDVAAQIAICANAELVVAPHGAGMANMIFAPRGCHVVELIPERYMVRFFWQLAVDCGHRYAVLVGRASDDGGDAGVLGGTLRWRTDTDALERLLGDLGCRARDAAA